jgi:hypothetical protein
LKINVREWWNWIYTPDLGFQFYGFQGAASRFKKSEKTIDFTG